MIDPIEDVADTLLTLPDADVESSYAFLFLVVVVGGWRMEDGRDSPLPAPPAPLDRHHGGRWGELDASVASPNAPISIDGNYPFVITTASVVITIPRFFG